MAWKGDHYYKDCITVRDENGKIIPKEIETPDSVLFVFNEWYWDDIMGPPESPEDAMIAAIDGDEEESVPCYEDMAFKPFELHVVAKAVLSEQEYDIWYSHYVDATSYRKIGKRFGKSHTVIFAAYRLAMAKIKQELLTSYLET